MSNELPTYRIGIEGNQANPTGGYSEPPIAVEEDYHPTYWVSHRMGPFLVHLNNGTCTPQQIDNHAYSNHLDALIEQGFIPCPKCNPS